MSAFKLYFNTDNSAFDDRGPEITRILERVNTQVREGRQGAVVRDINGNLIGDWKLINTEEAEA